MSAVTGAPSESSNLGAVAPMCEALPTLPGSGFALREIDAGDAGALADLAVSGSAWPFTSVVPAGPADCGRFIRWLQDDREAGRGFGFGVETGGDTSLVGLIRFRRLDARFKLADAAFLFDEASWDSPLPKRSLELALDYAFRTLGLHRLEIRTMAAREAALLRELGATLEGRLREAWPAGDRLVDQTLWSVLESDWPAERDGRTVSGAVTIPFAAPSGEPPAPREPQDPPPLWAAVPPHIRRPGVVLREILAEDGPMLLGTFGPEEIRVCIDPPTTTAESFRRYVAWAQKQRTRGRAVSFAIQNGEDPDTVGLVQVRRLEQRASVAEMGILLAPACRGTGLFSVAMRVVLDFTFKTMGVHRLEARTSGTNRAGEGSLKKLGAVREAHLRGSFQRGESYEDEDLWSILSYEWCRSPRPAQGA